MYLPVELFLRFKRWLPVMFLAVWALLAWCEYGHAQGAPVKLYDGTPFAVAGDLDNSTDVSIKAAAAGVQHCASSIQVSSLVAGSDQTVRLLSNDTVIWAFGIDTALSIGTSAIFGVPVCTVTGEALEIDVSGDPTDDLIVYSVQGFSRVVGNDAVRTTP